MSLMLPVAVAAQAKDTSAAKVVHYLQLSKSEFMGSVCWLLVPGGGHFYAEDYGNGFLWAFADLSIYFVWYRGAVINDGDVIMPALIFVGTRVMELVDSWDSVRKYNKQLALRLRISHNGPQATLSIPL